MSNDLIGYIRLAERGGAWIATAITPTLESHDFEARRKRDAILQAELWLNKKDAEHEVA